MVNVLLSFQADDEYYVYAAEADDEERVRRDTEVEADVRYKRSFKGKGEKGKGEKGWAAPAPVWTPPGQYCVYRSLTL